MGHSEGGITSTKLVCLASRTVTTACTSSISFCFSSSSNCMYHLARRVLPARFWMRMKRIWGQWEEEKVGGAGTVAPGLRDPARQPHHTSQLGRQASASSPPGHTLRRRPLQHPKAMTALPLASSAAGSRVPSPRLRHLVSARSWKNDLPLYASVSPLAKQVSLEHPPCHGGFCRLNRLYTWFTGWHIT